jgi:hypothetical protein
LLKTAYFLKVAKLKSIFPSGTHGASLMLVSLNS